MQFRFHLENDWLLKYFRRSTWIEMISHKEMKEQYYRKCNNENVDIFIIENVIMRMWDIYYRKCSNENVRYLL